jgi:hypothetical protein
VAHKLNIPLKFQVGRAQIVQAPLAEGRALRVCAAHKRAVVAKERAAYETRVKQHFFEVIAEEAHDKL